MKLPRDRHFVEDAGDERLYVGMRLVLDATHRLALAMESSGKPRRVIAREAGMTVRQVEDLLVGERGLTFDQFAAIAYGADLYPRITFVPLADMDSPIYEDE